jgi:hypothetical protein
MDPWRAAALQQRQRRLLLRSSELRGRLAADAQVLRRPLALADQVRAGWRWLRAYPELPVAAVVVVALLRPRRALRWSWRGWAAWRRWRRLQRWLAPAR